MLSPRSFLPSVVGQLAFTALFHHAAAQVTTSCQPLNTTNCPSDPALGMDYTWYFNSTPNANLWETTAGTVEYDVNNGATFTINKQGDSPTIRTKFYYFFGRTEVWMKTAPGTGIISSVMMLSDDLDEVDWEFMGGNGTHAETNYFGKGRQDYLNAIYYPVSGGTQDGYHNYTTVWTSSSLQFYIDSALVRTLLPKDANNTNNYPQTPMRLSLGIWAGGDPSLPSGTRDWAGGTTDYTKGPFNFYIKSVRITDYTNGSSYSYGDMSGSYTSIKVASGNSTANTVITTGSTSGSSESISEKWNKLPSVAKTAIYASAAGVGVAFLAWAIFYCIRQRRRGAREAAAAEKKYNEEQLELARMKQAGVDPDALVHQSEYNAHDMQREGISGKDSYSVPSSPAMSPSHEKWGAAAAVGAGAGAGAGLAANASDMRSPGMRSPMPLLQTGAQSPRVMSPGPSPYSDHGMNSVSPVHSMNHYNGSQSPSPRQVSPVAVSPVQRFGTPGANRSFSASPGPNIRVGSPGPQQAGYGGMPRVASPPIQSPQPQRSFTGGPYGGGPQQEQQQPTLPFGGQQPGRSPTYHGSQGGDAYWNGNGYGR